ncbi:MAG: hypothetical protein J5J06_11660 [Phycisphaerae bacterium]|nr:hypothetical protein [Phycisphaerae bacterium]
MIGTRFDPLPFFGATEHVALSVAASEIFSLLKRSLDLPPTWGALVSRTRGDHVVVAAGGEVPGADADSVMFFRTTPLQLTMEEKGLATKDGFQAGAGAAIRLSLIPDRGELLSFQRAALGSHRVMHLERLAAYLAPAVRATLGRFAAGQDAAALTSAQSGSDASLALAEGLAGPCFDAGLRLEGKPTVRFTSESYDQVRRVQEDMARRRSEHEAARQLQEAISDARDKHLDRLHELLEKLDSLAADSPNVALPDLMRTFSERERGELYEALFAAEQPATRTQWVVVAIGEELLFYDGSRPVTPVRRFAIGGQAGPVRSVQAGNVAGKQVLLLGAQRGVYTLPIERAEPDATYLVPNAPSPRGGFNSVAVCGGFLYASHSELGLYEWKLGEPGSARRLFEASTADADAVRGVNERDGVLYASIDAQIIAWQPGADAERPGQTFTGSSDIITALLPTGSGLLAGNSRGDVLRWKAGQFSEPETIHRGGGRPVESVWLVRTRGVDRLFFTDTTLHVTSRVLGDTFLCRYEAGGQTLRRVEVAPDALVATNDLRDRLIVWRPGQPARPELIVPVGSQTGRSVQDVCLVALA